MYKKSRFRIGISLIIPMKNEGPNVRILFEEIIKTFKNSSFPWEVIFVDDGSDDDTYEILDSLIRSGSKAKACRLYPSQGQSAAISEGIRISSNEYIGLMDGDGQNDPEDILRMYQYLQQNFGIDFVQGCRYPRRKDSFLRKFLSKGANKLSQIFIRTELSDLGCATKVFKRRVADVIPFTGEVHRIYGAYALVSGFKVVEMKVKHRPRVHGNSKYGYSRIWKFILDVVFLKLNVYVSTRPIYALGFVSLCFFTTSLLGISTAILLKVSGYKDYIDGTLMTFSAVMFSIGVLTMLFGLVTNTLLVRLDKIQEELKR